MTSRLRLIAAIAAATAALGAAGNALSEPFDAQSHAAALLSVGHTPATLKAHERADAPSSAAPADARASAAALLIGDHSGEQARTSARIVSSALPLTQQDARAHAAALLSGSRNVVGERSRITAIDASSGEHPAVLVARTYGARGIDPNQFIVMHPARLQLVDASPTE
jgi:hypothetical protein